MVWKRRASTVLIDDLFHGLGGGQRHFRIGLGEDGVDGGRGRGGIGAGAHEQRHADGLHAPIMFVDHHGERTFEARAFHVADHANHFHPIRLRAHYVFTDRILFAP